MASTRRPLGQERIVDHAKAEGPLIVSRPTRSGLLRPGSNSGPCALTKAQPNFWRPCSAPSPCGQGCGLLNDGLSQCKRGERGGVMRCCRWTGWRSQVRVLEALCRPSPHSSLEKGLFFSQFGDQTQCPSDNDSLFAVSCGSSWSCSRNVSKAPGPALPCPLPVGNLDACSHRGSQTGGRRLWGRQEGESGNWDCKSG